MKRLIRMFVISGFSLWVVNYWFPEGLVLSGGTWALVKAALGLGLINWLIKPLVNMVMLPVNLLTFGLFRWVTNVLVLWLVVRFIGGIAVRGFSFHGLTYQGIVFPAITFSELYAWIFLSFLISLISSLVIWLMSK